MKEEKTFELVEIDDDNKQVIIRVNACNEPIFIAKHPYIQKDYAYITVQRGFEENEYTIIRKNGTTWTTSDNTMYEGINMIKLKQKIRKLLKEKQLLDIYGRLAL